MIDFAGIRNRNYSKMTLRCSLGFHKMEFDDSEGRFGLTCKVCEYHWPEPWMLR